jgi:hypothetical protein
LAKVAQTLEHQEKESEGKERRLDSFKPKRALERKSNAEPPKIQRLKVKLEIRKRIGRGEGNKQIMEKLGLPKSTYYRFLRSMYEADEKILSQHDESMLSLELSILHDRLTASYARLLTIVMNDQVPVKTRLRAELEACRIAVAVARLGFEGPIAIKDRSLLQYSLGRQN